MTVVTAVSLIQVVGPVVAQVVDQAMELAVVTAADQIAVKPAVALNLQT